MSTAQQIPVKYVKSLLATGSTDFTPSHASRFVTRLLYEFWGFCVNGGTSLVEPGGFADLAFPPGCTSGSSVLLARGADGSTTFGTDVFGSLSVNFGTLASGSLIGKYLVTWVPGGSSTDDSVYRIISVEDNNHIRVDVHSGGTRRLGNRPTFWNRHDINWRVVDLVAATHLTGWQSGHFVVMNMVAAPAVNSGQAISQVKVTHLTQTLGFGTNLGLEGNIGLTVSPSGTWNVTSGSFSDAASSSISTWFNGVPSGSSPSGQVAYTFIGGGDFLIGEARSYVPGPQGNYTSGSGFHVEIPQRLYPSGSDPNPIAWTTWANATPSQVANTYYDGLRMVSRDGTTRRWTTLVRSPGGTQVRPDYTGRSYGTGQWQQFALPAFRFAFVSLDIDEGERLSSDGLLSLPAPGQFCSARARLRRVRFTTADMQQGSRLGDPVDDGPGWVHVSNGVLWPWDNSILPAGPWRFGV